MAEIPNRHLLKERLMAGPRELAQTFLNTQDVRGKGVFDPKLDKVGAVYNNGIGGKFKRLEDTKDGQIQIEYDDGRAKTIHGMNPDAYQKHIIDNGYKLENDINGLSDYDLFKSIHYVPQKYGRDNYVKGEEEEIWNKLSEYFDLPRFNPYMYSFGVNDENKTVNLYRNGVYDTVNKSGWLRKPLDYGQIKRRR